jgi:DNA-binding MarR family transcriptional regulator
MARRTPTQALPQSRWLDDDEQQSWRALVGLFVRLPAQLDQQLRRDAGISHFDYQVLAILSEAPTRTMRMTALASSTEGSLPRLSQVVARLEAKGWVRRSTDPADGRCTLAVLTAKGAAKLAATAPGHVEAVRSLVFDSLTKGQQQQLGVIGRRIVDAIDAAESVPSPGPA